MLFFSFLAKWNVLCLIHSDCRIIQNREVFQLKYVLTLGVFGTEGMKKKSKGERS